MARIWRCVSCGRKEIGREAPGECVCGAERPFVAVSARGEPIGRRTSVLAAELGQVRTARVSTGNPAVDRALGGGLPVGASIIVRGPEGSGKSRTVLQWITGAGPGLFVSLEMSLPQAKEVAESVGVDTGRLYLAQDLDGAEEAAEQARARVVAVDSISVIGRGRVARARELGKWAKKTGRVLLLVSHENKRRQLWGSSQLGYAGDVTIRLTAAGKSEARAQVLKSRYGPRSTVRVRLAK